VQIRHANPNTRTALLTPGRNKRFHTPVI
jgi:hypothetical protein